MPLSPLYSTSQSDWTALPGLYISSRNVPTPYLGVTRNSVGTTGECVRGPVNTAVSVTDQAYFAAVFGGRDAGAGGTYTGLVHKALLNKKFGEIVVVRAAASDAVAATLALTSTGPVTNATVTAANVGLWGNDITVQVKTATNGDSNYWDLEVVYLGVTYLLKNLHTTSGVDNTADVIAAMWPDQYQRLITITKGTSGRPDSGSATALASGVEGTIADSDFTATNGPMEKLATYPGLVACWIAERDHSDTLKDKWETLAASAYDRVFIMGPPSSTTSATDTITDAADYHHKRIVFTFNHPLTTDPSTALNITTRPESWLASVLSQTATDVHPISQEASQHLVGVKQLTNTITRAQHILLKNGGVMAMDFDHLGAPRYATGITSSVTAGEEDLAQRRMRDALELDLARLLVGYIGAKNSTENRAAVIAEVASYLEIKKSAQTIVDDYATPAFIETSGERAAGLVKLSVRVKTFSHWLYLVIDTQIGPSVSIEEADTLPLAA